MLALMADARSNADIARALTVTDAAVSKHVGDIVMKLGLSVSSRPAA
ncbi:DNA-binding NarL/FixJ family response regulator [Microbacterium sp. SORGH_AS 888]|nr:DNA-binding NarL/FixJ family response regulator [Microbacterium sp. SORGH_AS_0888]